MKKLMLAVLLAGCVFPGVSAAVDKCVTPQDPIPDPNDPRCQVNHPDCSFDANRQESVTGQNYEGAIWGYVADSDGDAVSIRCFLTVNGAEVGAEASGSGTGVAVAAGPISFAATAEDDVDVCAEVNGVFAECFQAEHQQIPPQEVIDATNSVLEQVDPTICPFIAALAGTYGVIEINAEGDIDVNGGGIYDCPPYDI